jgi:hypothetical protein
MAATFIPLPKLVPTHLRGIAHHGQFHLLTKRISTKRELARKVNTIEDVAIESNPHLKIETMRLIYPSGIVLFFVMDPAKKISKNRILSPPESLSNLMHPKRIASNSTQ